MRLALDSDPRVNFVRSYGNGVIVVGAQQIGRPCIITPQQLVLDWDASSIVQMTEQQLEPLLTLRPSILLLGAGDTQQLTSPSIRALCRSRGIALECMNLGAACRTFNILASEQRAVAAGLFPR
jgi:uncharacterized protein